MIGTQVHDHHQEWLSSFLIHARVFPLFKCVQYFHFLKLSFIYCNECSNTTNDLYAHTIFSFHKFIGIRHIDQLTIPWSLQGVVEYR